MNTQPGSNSPPPDPDFDLRAIEAEAAEQERDAQAEREELIAAGVQLPEAHPLPTAQTASVGRFLDRPAPAREYVFRGLLPRGIVGGIFSGGGVGKSWLCFQLAYALATGRRWSVFDPPRPMRVLYLAAEDSEDELHRRFEAIAEVMGRDPTVRERLFAISVVGMSRPIVEMGPGGVPTFDTDGFRWLSAVIESIGGLDVLILDPMSRLFAAAENDNACVHAWVRALEALALRHGLTIIFVHHESKGARRSEAHEAEGRGGSALLDGVRWVAGLRPLDPSLAEQFEVDDRHYVVFDIAKQNYAPVLPGPVYLERAPSGALRVANLQRQLAEKQAADLARILAGLAGEGIEPLTARDLGKPAGAAVRKALGNVTRRSISKIVDLALERRYLRTDSQGQRLVLVPHEVPREV